MLPAFLTTLCWASSSVLSNRIGQLVGARAANLARLSLAAGLLAIYAHGFGRGLGGAGLPFLALSGALGIGCGDVAFFVALPLLGSRLTTLVVQCGSAPLAALFEWWWLGTTLGPAQLGFGGAILAGVALAVAPERAPHPDPENATHDRALRRRGLACGLTAALGQALGAVLTRKAYAVGGAIDGGSAAYQRVLGGLVVVSIAFFLFRGRPRVAGPPRWREARPWIIASALAGPTLGVTCFQWALRTAPTAVVLPIVATTPLAVIPLAYFLERERPGVRSLLGGAVAVAGAVGLAAVR